MEINSEIDQKAIQIKSEVSNDDDNYQIFSELNS